jgi:hypothetical protein
MRLLLAAALVCVGCERSGPPAPVPVPAPVPGPRDAGPPGCEPLPFAASIPLAEASGAALFEDHGKPTLIVVGDSDNDGAYELLDPDTGAVREDGKLALGTGASDDIEGVAFAAGALFGLTSAGSVRTWIAGPGGVGFGQPGGPYPISGEAGFICPPKRTNCRKNYEGLCLQDDDRARCVGFAASKADGRLWCVVLDHAGNLTLDTSLSIPVAGPGVLADCSFSPDGQVLLAGANGFGADRVWRVDGWRDPAHARLVSLGALGPGFAEVVVAGPGGVVYRFSDLGGAPSLAGKFRCPAAGR